MVDQKIAGCVNWANELLHEAFELIEVVLDELPHNDETRNARAELSACLRAIESADTAVTLVDIT